VLVILGTIFISFTKKGEDVSEVQTPDQFPVIPANVPLEGPGLAIFFGTI